MKLKKYNQYFLTGDWHTHSIFSDGKNTLEEIIETSISLGLKLIAITDHVDKETNWIDEYVREMNKVKKKYNEIIILAGLEAKVIDMKGNIDAKDDFYTKVDIVLAAFHRIPTNNGFIPKKEIIIQKRKVLENWYKGMLALLENPNIDIIAHPMNLLLQNNIRVPYKIKEKIVKKAEVYQKAFEINLLYKVPDSEFVNLLKKHSVPIVIGSDAHNINELKKIHQPRFQR